MSINKKIFFCLKCNSSSTSMENFSHILCEAPFYIVQADVTFKINRTRLGRFGHWVYSRNIGLGLAIIGILGINGILMQHLQLGFWQNVFESIFVGLLIPHLLYKG